MSKIILHCDLNCFYASVEMLYNPELRNIPMAVAGDIENRHGIILAKNVLAKRYGIKTGEVIFKAKNKCPDLIICKPNYDNYLYYSQRVKSLYYEYTDKVESFGLDECWLDITGSIKYFGSINKIVSEILNRVKEEIGLTLSIGISNNKIYAKLASDLASEDNYYVIDKKEEIYHLPANTLLGIGKSTDKLLKSYGINTIRDIACADINHLKNILGRWGETLYYFSNGYDLSEVKQYEEEDLIKSIGNSSTSIRDLMNIEDIKMMLKILSDSVASRCKDAGLYYKVVHLSLRNNKLETRTIQKKLNENSNLADDIYNNALKLFNDNCDFKYPYRSIGVSVSKLSFKKDISQIDLFNQDNIYSLKELKKEEAIDTIRNRFGYYKISSLSLIQDRELTHFNPKKEHIIFPSSYFKN